MLQWQVLPKVNHNDKQSKFTLAETYLYPGICPWGILRSRPEFRHASQQKLTLLLGLSSGIGACRNSGSLPPTLRDAGASPATDHARIQGGPPPLNPGSMGYSRFINVPLQARGWVCETGARIEEAKLPIFESIRLFFRT